MQTTNAEKQRSYERLIAIFGLVTLVFGSTAVAQVENRHSTHRTRYRVVDLGTVGGRIARDGNKRSTLDHRRFVSSRRFSIASVSLAQRCDD